MGDLIFINTSTIHTFFKKVYKHFIFLTLIVLGPLIVGLVLEQKIKNLESANSQLSENVDALTDVKQSSNVVNTISYTNLNQDPLFTLSIQDTSNKIIPFSISDNNDNIILISGYIIGDQPTYLVTNNDFTLTVSQDSDGVTLELSPSSSVLSNNTLTQGITVAYSLYNLNVIL